MFSGIALGSGLFARVLGAQTSNSLRIGIIGSGRMGGAVGLRLAEAGHEVFFSSRNPEQLDNLVSRQVAERMQVIPLMQLLLVKSF